ncbi:hypothetical protein [Halodurantibacterium flavum]|uniref:Transcriptional regulator n=1 Tax=Halodurantibacterium flavum TaxID=1382802 RepID=A0ABW4S9X9_9RHOB
MPNVMSVAHAHMVTLIRKLGCLDAAAELLNARYGGGHSKGTISRKINGTLDWTLRDVVAFEDALTAYPVTRLLVQRKSQEAAEGCLIAGAAEISREMGEAMSAILSVEQSASAGEVAQAIKEIEDVKDALARVAAILRGRQS